MIGIEKADGLYYTDGNMEKVFRGDKSQLYNMSCKRECLSCGKCSKRQIALCNDLDASYSCEQRSSEPLLPEPETRSGFGDCFGIAIDIGTTNVVLALLNLSNGELLARHSFMNPQHLYGPDVISRIHSANQGKLAELKSLITDSISGGINTLLSHAKVENAAEIIIAGNTAMIYLLLGLSCESLGKSPFKPAFQLKENYELFGRPARICPWFSAFAGGDILAGLLNVLHRGEDCFLLIDLGTNGEIALYNKGTLTVTATAAGPAFEGSRHRGGASVILDDLAKLLDDGVIDKTGLICGDGLTQETDFTSKKTSAQETISAPETAFTQKEIRDLQLAKSAVRSGIEILLHSAELNYTDLKAVYLAGGIGQAINIDSAITVGLLPEELKKLMPGGNSKVSAVGNASLWGAIRLLLAPEGAGKDMQKLLANYTDINLAGHPLFEELFVRYLDFN
ncbi:MAG: ASKHA domain-containing protein [Lachnospiraceae bacterium]|nr:ASKHA domain-containing protein [Lachnospiraceae bacterium]